MITNFDDLCLWTYVTVDDIVIELAPLRQRPGPCPACSDSELIAMILVAECKGGTLKPNCSLNSASTRICSLYCRVKADSIGAGAT